MLTGIRYEKVTSKLNSLKIICAIGFVLSFILSTACSNQSTNDTMVSGNIDPIIVRVTGYGAFASDKDRMSEAKRLMAMRASKLDAYRSLAERVYGTALVGNSTIREFVMRDDSFRTAVDAVIRGARVVSVLDNKRGSFETVVELQLDAKFRECLTQVNQFKYNNDCLIPLPNTNDLEGTFQARSNGGSGKSMGSSLYYLK